MDRRRGAIRGAVGSVAIVWLVTTGLLVAVNVTAWAWQRYQVVHRPIPVVASLGDGVYDTYPGWSRGEVDQLLRETWLIRQFAYEPYAQFRELPREGRYVNVSPHGFRVSSLQGAWPPEPAFLNVFVFGGSRTFGYGVKDDDTIPSQLGRLLDGSQGRAVRIYNFGRGYFFSEQERVLFERLLSDGHRPDLAVFLDGGNDTAVWQVWGAPIFSDVLETLWARSGESTAWRLPFVRLFDRSEERSDRPVVRRRVTVAKVLEHYDRQRQILQALGGTFGVKILNVWEPVPDYGDALEHHAFSRHFEDRAQRGAYVALARRLGGGLPAHFAWCADALSGVPHNLYVDRNHMNPEGNGLVARCIADALEGRPRAPLEP